MMDFNEAVGSQGGSKNPPNYANNGFNNYPNQQPPQIQTYPTKPYPTQAYPNQQPGQPYGYQQQHPGPINPSNYANNQPNYAGNSITVNNNINPTQQTYPTQQVPAPTYPNQQPAQLPGYQQQQPAAISPDTPFYNLIGVWKIEHLIGFKEFTRVSHIIWFWNFSLTRGDRVSSTDGPFSHYFLDN